MGRVESNKPQYECIMDFNSLIRPEKRDGGDQVIITKDFMNWVCWRKKKSI